MIRYGDSLRGLEISSRARATWILIKDVSYVLKQYGAGFLFVVLLVVSSAVVAQGAEPADSRLLQMMAVIPVTPETLSVSDPLSYLDYRAVEATIPGLMPFTHYAEFAQADDARRSLWLAAARRFMSGPVEHLQYLAIPEVETMPQVVGFDVFEIDQGVLWGQPPTTGTFFVGDFDREAIRAAFTNREYTQEDLDGVEVWCPANGCDSGAQTNMRARNPGANPFGGQFGRQEPIILGDGWIFSSPSPDALELQITVLAGGASSVLALPQFSATANALLRRGEVLQVQFVNPGGLNRDDPVAQSSASREASPADVQTSSHAPLPPYSLVALADLVAPDNEDDLAVVALAYSSEADAQEAGRLLMERLQVATTWGDGQPWMTLLDRHDVRVDGVQVLADDDTGWFITLLTFRNPGAGMQMGAAEVTPGAGYRLLIDRLYRQDLPWLAYAFTPEE